MFRPRKPRAREYRRALARRLHRLIEAVLGGKLALAGIQSTELPGFHPHRIPAHRDARRQLRGLIIAPQLLPRSKLAVGQMPPRMQPGQRRFGDIDRHAAPPSCGRPAAHTLARHLAFHQNRPHVIFPLLQRNNMETNCQKQGSVGKSQTRSVRDISRHD
jgi:plasmid stabilization system protein ParE